MRSFLFIFCILPGFASFTQSGEFALKNSLIIGQLEKADDRYTIEIALTELFAEAGVKAVPSLNVLKIGASIEMLANDSVQKLITAKGIDTYMTVSVRGYDKKFKLAENHEDFKRALATSHLFSLYRDELVNITFEFTIYREGKFMGTDLIRCGNVSDRDKVVKKFKKKVGKRIPKWMKSVS